MTAPLTRAQRFQWLLEKGIAEGLRPLPDPSPEKAGELVAALCRRFEVLRTSIEEAGGELRQRRHDEGAPLVVVDVSAESELAPRMAELAERFRTGRLGRTGSLLAQFALLRTADRGWLGLVADNVAVDAGFHRVIEQEIARLLGEPVAGRDILGGEPGIQPIEAAAIEASPRGERERRKAAEQLRAHFAEAPPPLHPHRPPDGTTGRYYRRTLVLPGADRLLADVVTVTGLLPSAVILAAFTQLLCRRSGRDTCAVNVSVDNRHHRELRLTLCATAQRVPVTLAGADQPLLSYAQRVQQSLSRGYPAYGRYDPADLLAERDRAQQQRGLRLGADLAFNFVPPPQGWTALVGEEHRPPAGPPRITGSATAELSYEYAASLSVRWSDAHTGRLSIHGDAEALPPDDAETVLRDLASTLTRLTDR